MNLRDIFKTTCAMIKAGNAVIIEGPPGGGKTDMMAKVAKWLVAENPGKRVGMSCCFMATQSSIGATGLPWKGELVCNYEGKEYKYTITDPAVPRWYLATDLATGEVRPANLFDIVLLILEEWGQGDGDTKRAYAEILRAGGTPPFYLPPGSPRIALTNVDARDGVTKEFDFVIGRRGALRFTGDADIWVEDFADKPYQWQGKTWEVMPFTKSWAKRHPEILFENKPEKQGPWCNPRTLTMADRFCQVMRDMHGGEIPVNSSNFMEGLSGLVGMPATVSYVGELQFLLEIPQYEDVVADPQGTPVPTKADLQMLMAYELAGRVKVEHLPQVIEYMSKKPGMPQDMSVAFVGSLLRRDYKSIINEPAMKAWISKNASLVHVIASVSQ